MNDRPENPIVSLVKDVPPEVVSPAQNAAAEMKPDNALQKLPQAIAGIVEEFRKFGVLNFMRGLALNQQMETAKLMQALGQQIKKLEQKQRKRPSDYAALARLMDSYSRLYFQVTQSQNHLLEIEKLSPSSKPEREKPLVKSFLPGQIVGMSLQPERPKPGV